MPELSRADWVREATRTLHEAAVDSPRLSAELILQHVCGISRVELATRPETFLTSDQLPAWPVCSAAGPMANPPPTFSDSANSTAGTSGSRPPPSFPALKPSTSSKRPSKAATAPPALRIWVRAAAASP